MDIGRKIYFDKTTGNVILDTGEASGNVVKTTIENDIRVFKELSERNRETFEYIELEYGQYLQDFQECNGYRVNPTTKKLEFSYPDPNTPIEEQEPVYRKPFSEELEEKDKEIKLLKAQSQAIVDRTDFHEEVLAEIILAINP